MIYKFYGRIFKMDGNEKVPFFTRIALNISKKKFFLFSVVGILLSIAINSTVFNVHPVIFFIFSFILGCLAAFYISRNAMIIPSLICRRKNRHNKVPESVQHTGCLSCDVLNCTRHNPDLNLYKSKPWMDLKVPQEIDEALEEILNLVLERHIYSWYSSLSTDESFIQEIRGCLRFLAASLLRRILRVDLVHLITVKIATPVFQHLECYLEGKKLAQSSRDIESAVLSYLGNDLHTAMESRQTELLYLRQLIENLLPFVAQKKYLQCRSAVCLVREIFCNIVFLPIMDILADPDTLNLLLILFFDKTPMVDLPDSQKPPVEFLEHFVAAHATKPQSILHTDLRTVLEDQSLLYLFMSFLKEECSVNVLQFLLTVDDFNSMILNPDLTKTDLENLHLQAQELYNTYFASNAVDRINFDEEISSEIKNIISGLPENVIKLRTTTPLFRAYDHAYGLLEQTYCPMFLQSDKYYHLICGERCGVGMNKNQGRGNKKDTASPSTMSKLGNKIKGVFVTHIDEGTAFEEEAGTDLAEALFPDGTLQSNLYGNGDVYRMDNDPRLKKLSAWRVFIPRVVTGMDQNCKYYHAFHIEIQRIDVQDNDNPDDLHWQLERRYNEFYVLEAKLTEFHGELPFQLPPKRSQNQRGIQFLETRRPDFEKFLQTLLTLPSLQGSELLYKFLRTPIPFTSSFLPDIKLGRMIKTVPRKLIKEKGQHLLPFLQAFLASTEAAKPKPSKLDWNQIHEVSSATVTEKLTSGIFGDNLASIKGNTENVDVESRLLVNLKEIYDYIYYLAIEVVHVPDWLTLLLSSCDSVLRPVIQDFTQSYLSQKLQQALMPQRLAEVINILRDALFFDDDPPRTKRQKSERARQALTQAKDYFPGCIRSKGFEDGLTLIFEGLQCPLLNKQLSYILLDILAVELFPELQESTHVE